MPSKPVTATNPEHELTLVDAVAQLSFLVQGALARAAGAHGLSVVQTRLLGILRDREPGINQLAEVLELDKSSVTGLVTRAEQRGLVVRTVSTEDRRAVRVALTAKGRRQGDVIAREFAASIDGLVGGLAAKDQEALSSLASRVVASRHTEP